MELDLPLFQSFGSLAERLAVFVNPVKRLYLPFLLGAVALASAVWFFRYRRRWSLVRYLFPRRIWLHPSTLLDVRLMLFRTVLEGLLIAPFAIPVTTGAVGLARLGWHHLGLVPDWFTLPRAAVTVLFSVAAFCAEDFGRYFIHLLAHRVPALWELHKVHHSAEVLTPLTVYRTHPIESVVMRAGAAGSLTLVAGLFIWLFPGRVGAWQIGGVYALSFIWNVLGSNLRHSHVWLSYPPWLERFLLSPAQHQLHHSTDPGLHHGNYGSALAIWDRLAGSLKLSGRRRRHLEFGLPPDAQNHRRTVRSVLWHPLVAALRRVVPQ
ncbi:MAG: sterol desaturase family protein [Archangiaceae bacterium]|nr:sterol desaturase family protein [Archangiaceae bacterium]